MMIWGHCFMYPRLFKKLWVLLNCSEVFAGLVYSVDWLIIGFFFGGFLFYVDEQTLIAKKLHFEYSTPKKNLGFRKNIYLQDDFGEFNEVVVAPPNAPRQIRVGRSRLIGKKLADISVALFRSDDDGGAVKWQRSGQILQMATQV